MGGCCSSRRQTRIYDTWEANMPSMTGKVVAITGCTSGTGLILAETCARKGATVVLLNRQSERAEQALRKVTTCASEGGGPTPIFIPADLMSFKSVHEAGDALSEKFSKQGIDVLVNNAGIMAFPDKPTADGFDVQMQTNHLSHFLLTKLCMPLLETAADQRGEARIVNHSSAARVLKDMGNKLDAKYLGKNGGNLGGDSNEMFKGPQFQRYQQTKLANVVFTYALDAKLKQKGSRVKALVAHPGVAMDTGLATQTFNPKVGGVKAPPIPLCLMVKVLKTQSMQDGTVGILYCTCDPSANSGDFFGPLGKGGGTGIHDPSEYSGKVGVLKREPFADDEAQVMLWTESENSTGVKFEI